MNKGTILTKAIENILFVLLEILERIAGLFIGRYNRYIVMNHCTRNTRIVGLYRSRNDAVRTVNGIRKHGKRANLFKLP